MQPHILRANALRRHAALPDELVEEARRNGQPLGGVWHRQEPGGLIAIRRRLGPSHRPRDQQRLKARDLHEQTARLVRGQFVDARRLGGEIGEGQRRACHCRGMRNARPVSSARRCTVAGGSRVTRFR